MNEKSQIKYPTIYNFFKHNDNEMPNNYLYVTMFLAYPLNKEGVFFNSKFPCCITVRLTEEERTTTLLLINNKWHYIVDSSKENKGILVIYKSLYDIKLPYATPLNIFLREVDHEKHPDVKQKYEFELLEEI